MPAETHLTDAIAARLRGIRAELHESQHAFGARLGWSQSKVSAIETGTTLVQLDELPHICRTLDAGLADLLTRARRTDRNALRL